VETHVLPPPLCSSSTRHFAMVAVCLTALLALLPAARAAFHLALHDDRYLQVIVSPLECAFLLFWGRAEIFAEARYSPKAGVPLLVMAALCAIFGQDRVRQASPAGLPVAVTALLGIWLGAFCLCYGWNTIRAALYPLACLLLAIPFPAGWMERVAAGLQQGSASLSYAILRVSGVPVFRQGLVFTLPGLNFQVGPECSGIHSSLALLMIAVVAGYVYLRSGLARAALILLTVPIALFKNAVRIVTIALLGAYVNRSFVDGPFHHRYGGLAFSVLGVLLFGLLLTALQNAGKRKEPSESTRSNCRNSYGNEA
jgi:exosortase